MPRKRVFAEAVKNDEVISSSLFVFPTMTTSEKPLEAIEDKANELADRDADSVDSDIRYMAYGARIRTALRASTRYIAYVRTIGRG